MNKLLLGGRLATDLRIQSYEDRKDGTTKQKASFLLAFTGRNYQFTQFIWCQVWNQKKIEQIQKYFRKGDFLIVEGELSGLQSNEEEAKEKKPILIVEGIYDYIKKREEVPAGANFDIPEEPSIPGHKKLPWE